MSHRTHRAAARRVRSFSIIESLEERIALAVYAVTHAGPSGDGSLRQAIELASVNIDPDSIVFDAAFFSVPRTITIVSPTPQINGVVAITGPGSALLTVTRAGGAVASARNVFNSFATDLRLTGMTVTGGDVAGGNGGGLLAVGINPNITLDDMVFTANRTTGDGGGISLGNNATLTIRNSVVSGNTARAGGGIFFFQRGSLVMERTTVSGNTSTGVTGLNVGGGGIYFSGDVTAAPPAGFIPGTMLIRDSTIDNNATPGGGGGIGLDSFVGGLLIQNSTLSGNRAGTFGGGIGAAAGTGAISLQNATVTANSVTGAAATHGGGGISRTSNFNNTLDVENTVVSANSSANAPDIRTDAFTTTRIYASAIGSAAGFTLAASGGNLPFNVSPLVGPLADNGGPTRTHMPQPGSPLANNGGNARVPAGMAFDQRGAGFPRITGQVVDIGSVELVAPPRVVSVLVSSAAGWTAVFKDYLAAQGLGDATYGFAVPGGADQLKILPWIGINRISVRFTENVTVAATNLGVTGLAVSNYAVADFGYDPSTFTATWYLAQTLRNDRLLLNLDADAGGVFGANGALDGEWTNGARAFPSGNGFRGGDFRFAINLLPGDVDRAVNSRVATSDINYLKARLNRSAAELAPPAGFQPYTVFADVDGSGRISTTDVNGVKARLNNVLPSMPPALIAAAGVLDSPASPGDEQAVAATILAWT